MPCRLLVYVFWIIKMYTCGKKRCTILKVYGQLVLLPTVPSQLVLFHWSTCTFFATRTLVNSYFFFGQLVLFFFVQLVLLKKLLTVCYVSLLWHSFDL